MKIEKIAFEQLFPTGVYANQRLRVEIALGEGQYETPENAFALAKQVVNDAFVKMNPQITWSESGSPVEVKQVREEEPVDKIVQAIIRDIESCEVIDDKNTFGVQYGLIAYESAAQSNPEIKAAYDLKYKQLSK